MASINGTGNGVPAEDTDHAVSSPGPMMEDSTAEAEPDPDIYHTAEAELDPEVDHEFLNGINGHHNHDHDDDDDPHDVRGYDSSGYSDHTSTFPFPEAWYPNWMRGVDGYVFCQRLDCRRHPKYFAETATVHDQCFRTVKTVCGEKGIDFNEVKHRLWIAMSWRKPARATASTNLTVGAAAAGEVLRRVAEACGLQKLLSLPLELIIQIEVYSKHAHFWRTIKALAFVEAMLGMPRGPSLSVPLSEIQYWERGGLVLPYTSLPLLPIIRIAVDVHGIEKVERLPEMPTYDGQYSHSRVFIIEEASFFRDVSALIKEGRMRLRADHLRATVTLWNSPARIQFEARLASPNWNVLAHARSYAIELGKVDGISFLFIKGQVVSIHTHRGLESSASVTYDWYGEWAPDQVTWVYLPLSRSDRLLRFGAREYARSGRVFLVGTRMLGDVMFGRPGPGAPKRTMAVSSPTPLTLVYAEDKNDFKDIPVIGVIQKENPPAGTLNLGDVQWPQVAPRRTPAGRHHLRDAYFSSAPLSNVVSVTVFYFADTTRCRGIIFKYGNGGERSVGQCRVGVDRTERFDQPDGLYTQVAVEFPAEPDAQFGHIGQVEEAEEQEDPAA
ncbi:uncharacterized protein DNG_08231 [Cephalotrichum gorgonifer]|uniref:Uncharacterized protein n=1 Tax=Cephalotrichum gorgonifer TaxID=2041049 RepID=A0AAE8N4Q1_9PEZI|nr:uncharacterized protein DNG_08231 [Cephalotrichum gorgonifer]